MYIPCGTSPYLAECKKEPTIIWEGEANWHATQGSYLNFWDEVLLKDGKTYRITVGEDTWEATSYTVHVEYPDMVYDYVRLEFDYCSEHHPNYTMNASQYYMDEGWNYATVMAYNPCGQTPPIPPTHIRIEEL